jgi:gp16 family phage-associated protein
MAMKTKEQVIDEFRTRGDTVPDWAERHGFHVESVRSVIYGKSKARRGNAHKIAVLLGLKDGEIIDKRKKA